MAYAIAQYEKPITDSKVFGNAVISLVLDFMEIVQLCSNRPLYSPYLNEEDRKDIENAIKSLKEPGSIKLEDFKRELKNQSAIRFLDEWLAEPDDLGEEFWNSFRKELNQKPFHIE